MASPGGATGGLYAVFEAVGQIFYSLLIGSDRAARVKLRTHRVVVGGLISIGLLGVVLALLIPVANDSGQPMPGPARAAIGGLLGALGGGFVAMILVGYVSSIEYEEQEEKRRAELVAQGIDPDKKCFIATAVFDSPDSPEVLVLRRWRDRRLLNHSVGRLAVECYYTFSRPVADCLRNSPRLRYIARKALLRLVMYLSDK